MSEERKVNPKQSRFSDAPWFQEEGKVKSVQIGGAGGIGSWLAFFIARAGFKVYLYDFDLIEEHNMAGQLFTQNQIGVRKVIAVQDTIHRFTGRECVVAKHEKITMDTPVGKYVFSAFDNMEARKVLFTTWLQAYGGNPDAVFIDGRLNAEQYQIFCLTGDDVEGCNRYNSEFLFGEDEAGEPSCTFKQTTHIAAGIASKMTGYFTNFIANIQEGNKARKVPFYHELLSPVDMVIKTA